MFLSQQPINDKFTSVTLSKHCIIQLCRYSDAPVSCLKQDCVDGFYWTSTYLCQPMRMSDTDAVYEVFGKDDVVYYFCSYIRKPDGKGKLK